MHLIVNSAAVANLEVVEQLAGLSLCVAVHDLQELPCELHGCRLKPHPAATRGIAQQETKVNVDQVTAVSHHDVAIVPVLHLQIGAAAAVEDT